jgi:hypothetical protein
LRRRWTTLGAGRGPQGAKITAKPRQARRGAGFFTAGLRPGTEWAASTDHDSALSQSGRRDLNSGPLVPQTCPAVGRRVDRRGETWLVLWACGPLLPTLPAWLRELSPERLGPDWALGRRPQGDPRTTLPTPRQRSGYGFAARLRGWPLGSSRQAAASSEAAAESPRATKPSRRSRRVDQE